MEGHTRWQAAQHAEQRTIGDVRLVEGVETDEGWHLLAVVGDARPEEGGGQGLETALARSCGRHRVRIGARRREWAGVDVADARRATGPHNLRAVRDDGVLANVERPAARLEAGVVLDVRPLLDGDLLGR